MIYLDYAASSPVDPRVLAKMLPFLQQDGLFANASSQHMLGKAVQEAIQEARSSVATLLNAEPEEIIFTSGATESINLALKGAARFHQSKGKHIITLSIEHKAVLETCEALLREGFDVTYLKPLANGLVDVDALRKAMRSDTILVSIAHVNNEMGALQDLASIAEITQQYGVLLHVDAAQSIGKIAIDLKKIPIQLLSFTAHKLCGPKGAGVLYLQSRPRVRVAPLFHGGGHEQSLRAGTLATHQIIGLGEACRISQLEMISEQSQFRLLATRFWQGLDAALDQVILHGDLAHKVPHILNISFIGIKASALLTALPTVACSLGSACTRSTAEPSYVLRALGLSREHAFGAIRFSLGRFTTLFEIDQAITEIATTVNELRALSPYWHAREQPASSKSDQIKIQHEFATTGDCVTLAINTQDGKIVTAQFRAYGCSDTIALGQYLADWIIGKSATELRSKATIPHFIQAIPLPSDKQYLAKFAITLVEKMLTYL